MSALAERKATGSVCTRCGAQLAPDQDWCVECGEATTTRFSETPDWRVPVAVVGGVVLLAAAALVFLLVSLSNSANSSVAASSVPPAQPRPAASAGAKPRAVPVTRAATNPSASARTTTGTRITAWPAGVTGFTVVLGVVPDKAAATASAQRIAASGIPVGLLDSSDFSSMSPGDWIVFSGTYATSAEAAAAAKTLQGKGQTGAYEFSVVPATHTGSTPGTAGTAGTAGTVGTPGTPVTPGTTGTP